MVKLGSKLRRFRKSRRLTLANVGEETGLSVSFLSDVERGRTKPSLDTLEKLADFYGVSVNEVLLDTEFGGSRDEKEYPPGFQEFLHEIGGSIDEEMEDLLLRAENRSRRSAQTKEDWLRMYYPLKTLIGE